MTLSKLKAAQAEIASLKSWQDRAIRALANYSGTLKECQAVLSLVQEAGGWKGEIWSGGPGSSASLSVKMEADKTS